MSGYTVIRSRRRTLALQVTKDCRVVVRAPLYAAGDDIDRFVAEHEAWIAAQLARQAQRLTQHPPRSPEEQGVLRQKARLTLPPLVHFWARQMGVTPTGVKITSARKRYGSCSGKNSLCFSCFLMNCPEPAIDLVVVHELCHIRVKNHGPAFYALLERYLPDYRERKKLLR